MFCIFSSFSACFLSALFPSPLSISSLSYAVSFGHISVLLGEAGGPEDACLVLGTADGNPSSRLPLGRVGGGACSGGWRGSSEVLGVSHWAVGTWVLIMIFHTLCVGYANMKLFMILSKNKRRLCILFSLEMEATEVGWSRVSQGTLRVEMWAMNHEEHYVCFIHLSSPSVNYMVHQVFNTLINPM